MDVYSLQNNSISDLQVSKHAGKFHRKVLATVVPEKRAPFLFKELYMEVRLGQIKGRSLLSFKFIETVIAYLIPDNVMEVPI